MLIIKKLADKYGMKTVTEKSRKYRFGLSLLENMMDNIIFIAYGIVDGYYFSVSEEEVKKQITLKINIDNETDKSELRKLFNSLKERKYVTEIKIEKSYIQIILDKREMKGKNGELEITQEIIDEITDYLKKHNFGSKCAYTGKDDGEIAFVNIKSAYNTLNGNYKIKRMV
ncbi:hypothetical protein [Pseudoleptotrichia goodfellowii]|jgi:hypothetical protein|uniref:Uncharacterized protein n=1 Tax=Pseudoleptotrichia goodfellowii F0264 TaxID=596323 RepID=D0GIK0_9FUSO|nr:hypothetical protein [Pseudoleptotrichia goodfellowii]EEY36088.1 hypothetical protein HMPREF0554_0752 [Pseudoleptotrichia goodfellowii F0264]